MKKAFIFAFTSLIFQLNNAQVPKYNYHVKNKVAISNIDNNITRLALVLPLAQTNQYQTVSNVDTHGGEKLFVSETGDGYVRWHFTDSLSSLNHLKEIYYEFDIVLNAVNFDFDNISSIIPYDTAAENFKKYTGSSGAYVDPHNPIINEISNRLWNESSNVIDYARICYEFVAANYRYINPFTGLHTLQDILEAGGGDCGNLSSVFISLLRHRGIPARHIVTVKPDGVYHVWADFYLEKYGWIPVDVTFKNSDPEGNYFGVFDGNGIVMTSDVWLPLDRGNGEIFYAGILQSYYLWTWTNVGNHPVSTHELTSVRYAIK